MNQLSINQQRRSKEQGMYLILFTFMLLTLFAMIAMAFDAGNMFLAQMRLQRATDAAVVRGLSLANTLTPSQVELVSEQLAHDNMLKDAARMNLDPSTFSSGPVVDVQVSAPANQPTVITANGTVDVRTFMIDAVLPGTTSTRLVSTVAEGTQNEVIVSLVWDISGSMNCPADGSDCEGWHTVERCWWGWCWWDTDYVDCVSEPDADFCHPSKMDRLKDASVEFINMFDGATDQLSVIVFGTDADVVDYNDFENLLTDIIPDIDAGGWTNMNAGIELSASQIMSEPNAATAHKVMVLISDGAPTRGEKVCHSSSAGYYDAAILASDAARLNDITIYTVGLGAGSTVVYDPYQDIGDSLSLKPFLLKRVANDPRGADDPAQFPSECVQGYDQIASGKLGQYFETPDLQDLEILLTLIGESIKAHLTR